MTFADPIFTSEDEIKLTVPFVSLDLSAGKIAVLSKPFEEFQVGTKICIKQFESGFVIALFPDGASRIIDMREDHLAEQLFILKMEGQASRDTGQSVWHHFKCQQNPTGVHWNSFIGTEVRDRLIMGFHTDKMLLSSQLIEAKYKEGSEISAQTDTPNVIFSLESSGRCFSLNGKIAHLVKLKYKIKFEAIAAKNNLAQGTLLPLITKYSDHVFVERT